MDLTVDTCIVGAGIAGLTAAYSLAEEGRHVAVLDDGAVGSGMTGQTSAHLSWVMDGRYFELARLRGDDAARLASESHRAAIDRIESIAAAEGIDCDFARVDGYLFLAEGDKAEILERELQIAQRIGLPGVTRVERAPFDSFDTGPCLAWPAQGRFHPLKYLHGLAKAYRRHGGAIYCGTHADAIEGGTPARVRANGHTITAHEVIVATNVPVNDLLVIHTKQAPYMTYVVGLRIPQGTVPDVLAWDTGDPYHYIRVARQADHDVLIVGGEDHKSGQAEDTNLRHQRIVRWARERFPMALELEFAWAGQVMETVDDLCFSGRNPFERNVYVHTGDSGMGLTHGTVASMIICDLIRGRDNPWAELYDPARKPLAAAATYAAENLNVVKQYGDWFRGGDVKALDDIVPGSGAVLRHGLSKLAVYRDESGAFHPRSARCPHLGCVVQWNDAEKTWDCPCHGSRFDKMGGVINGPANSALEPAGVKDEKAA